RGGKVWGIDREVERGGNEMVSDVARFIDAKEEEGNTLRAGPLQRRQPMAGLFERYSEPRSEAIDIVSHRLRFAEERLVGHQERGGEIVREFNMTAREACSGTDFFTRRQLVEQLL